MFYQGRRGGVVVEAGGEVGHDAVRSSINPGPRTATLQLDMFISRMNKECMSTGEILGR